MEEKIIYLAGLFDGEGCVTYKQRLEHRKGKPRPYLYWQIRLEINRSKHEERSTRKDTGHDL
jgi:hypothetical protein